MTDLEYLELAMKEAEKSFEKGGFPAGAIIVKDGKIVGRGLSIGNLINDHTSHGEIAAIREASNYLNSYHLKGVTLYSSMQPCMMCFGAANWVGIEKIVFGCRQTEDLTSKGCYEGNTNIHEINNNNNRKIELVFIDKFENNVTNLVEKWLEQFKN